ncbi:Dihydroneopterin aldolase-domain-containing protein [Xylariaceae sp. FL0255]|nr:Dihydroneopterin aldolase-domain-containing protein [Xylariaceae sp. FL0255]
MAQPSSTFPFWNFSSGSTEGPFWSAGARGGGGRGGRGLPPPPPGGNSAIDPTIAPDSTPDPAAPLLSTFQVRAAAGEPRAVVRVRNLQSTMSAGQDAWGRSSKSQPVLLSSEISLAGSFETASENDTVADEGTVHYGTLSKTLLGGMADFAHVERGAAPAGGIRAAGAAEQVTPMPSTANIFELLWVKMTGRVVDGSQVALPAYEVPLLNARTLRSLSLTLHLPKASLLGSGVSLTTTACFKDAKSLDEEEESPSSASASASASSSSAKNEQGQPKKQNPLRSYARTLRLHELRIPTLIGVNDNERTAKQMVVADIEIDRFDIDSVDIHTELERLVVDTISESSFETLEALGTHVGNKILRDFRVGDDATSRGGDVQHNALTTMAERGWLVRIRMEKPIAVPFADCPSVEILMGGQ